MSDYTLTKLFIKEGHYSKVGVGRGITGYLGVKRYGKIIQSVEPSEILEDDEVFVSRGWDFIKTSPVASIDFNGKGYTFITETSIYHLDEIKEDTDEDKEKEE